MALWTPSPLCVLMFSSHAAVNTNPTPNSNGNLGLSHPGHLWGAPQTPSRGRIFCPEGTPPWSWCLRGARTMGGSGACDTDHSKVLKRSSEPAGATGCPHHRLAGTQLCGSRPPGEASGHLQTLSLWPVPSAAFADLQSCHVTKVLVSFFLK